jgi:mitogen-activated protein kinase kinase
MTKVPVQAIVDGAPPHLPTEGFSGAARDFVQGCLNKTPKLRPTYAMLLRHTWLAPLLKPPTISEANEFGAVQYGDTETFGSGVVDEEVAGWVQQAIENRQNNTMGRKLKPALHAAPLNVVPA